MSAMDPYADTAIHRFHATRRRLKKLNQLLQLVGLTSLVLAAGLLISGLVLVRTTARGRMMTMAAAYAGAGALCLLVRWPLEAFRERRFRGRGPEAEREGMALILVLLVLALVSALVLEAQVSARRALRREQETALRTRLELAAADAARQALQRLADDPDLRVDSTNEAWAASVEATDPTGLTTWTWVQDEDRFFDLNNLALPPRPAVRPAPEIVMDLLTLCGDFEPVGKVDALADWLDDNAEGAWESDYYRDLEPPYAAANRMLFSWSELLTVRGFSREMLEPKPRYTLQGAFQADLQEQVTFLPIERESLVPVNLNTVGPDVLRGLLGMQQDQLVSLILMSRARAPLSSAEPVLAMLDPALQQAVSPYLDVRSRFFRIDVRADAERQSARLQVLARRHPDGRVEVLQWWAGRAVG